MRQHLRDFKRANGPDANFKAWVATLHPENVTLDSRLWLEESEQLRMWRESGGVVHDRPSPAPQVHVAAQDLSSDAQIEPRRLASNSDPGMCAPPETMQHL